MAASTQDPAGNVPLLVFRIVERIALRHMSAQEWLLFRPQVAEAVERTFRPRRKRGRR
jgi:hypothetical protein